MKVLISTFGSHGDILPFAALAKEFADRGQEVVFFANDFFATIPSLQNIKFISIGTKRDYYRIFSNTADVSATKAFKAIATESARLSPTYYEAMQNEIEDGETIIISSPLLFAGLLLKETRGVFVVTINLSPSIFRSNINPPRLADKWITTSTPNIVKNITWKAMDSLFYEPILTKPLNKLRLKLGLQKVKNIFHSWIHSADLVIGLFPKWFASPQKEWPKNVVLMNFVIPDKASQIIHSELTSFLESDKPIVAVTVGTANSKGYNFFKTSIESLQKLDIKIILISHFDGQIPLFLPPNTINVRYVPFDYLLPKVSILIHHGGIGTTAVAMRAATPQIICPTAYDQFDNSKRAVELGVAKELSQKNYNQKNIAATVTELIDNKTFKQKSIEVASKFTQENTVKDTCDLIVSSFKTWNTRPTI